MSGEFEDDRYLPVDTFAWALALIPAFGMAALALVDAAATETDAAESGYETVRWVALAAVVLLAVVDQREIRQSGHYTPWGLILLTPAAYLIGRYHDVRGSSAGPMLLSIASYAILIVLYVMANSQT